MSIGDLGTPKHAVKVRLGVAEGDVAGNTFTENMIVLENDSYLVANITKVEFLEVTPIKEDRPSVGSMRLASSFTRVVFPLPLRPTIAMILPGTNSMLMPFKMSGASGPPYF